MKKRALLKPNVIVRTAGVLFFVLFVFAGCDEDKEGPSGPERVAWTQHEPVLEGNKLRAVVFASENEGWIVGREGVILHTGDGGATWSNQRCTNDNLWDVTFFDTDTGWAVGENGTLLRTTKGGSEWSATPFETTSDDLFSVAFEDGENGWAVGGNGTILRTIDGGRRWDHVTSGTNVTLRGISIFENVGLIVGDSGTILRATKDTGWSAWSPVTNGFIHYLWAVTLADSDRGWAVGEGGLILFTSDGGEIWTSQTSSVNKTLTDVVFISATTGFVVGSNGTILTTGDGGENWAVDTSATWHDLFGVCYAGQSDAWAVGNLTLLHSTNGGSSWSSAPSGTARYTDLSDITFVNEDIGWAVGYAGAILKTADGGDTWEYQKRDKIFNVSEEWFSDVMFVDSLRGWCVGHTGVFPYNGLLLHTSDGGRNWSVQDVDTTQVTQRLYGITFVDTTTGWAVGGNWQGNVGGVVFKTTDGGLTWDSLSIPTANQLEDVSFVNSFHGWAVGYGGTILHTIDGGQNWTNQYLGWKCTSWEVDSLGDSTCVDSTALFVPTLCAIVAIDSSHCWAVGKEGAILYTSDGGTTWEQQSSGTANELKAVTFLNVSTGWIVGAGGVILHTDDGGTTWKIQPSGTSDDLLGVAFIDRDYGWIVGGDKEGNSIILLSTTTGGQ